MTLFTAGVGLSKYANQVTTLLRTLEAKMIPSSQQLSRSAKERYMELNGGVDWFKKNVFGSIIAQAAQIDNLGPHSN